jgi:hypothetical protein
VFLLIGEWNGDNHGETRLRRARAVFNFNCSIALCYRACDPLPATESKSRLNIIAAFLVCAHRL